MTGDKTKDRGLHFEMLGKKSKNTLEIFLVVIYIHRVQSDLNTTSQSLKGIASPSLATGGRTNKH